MSNSAFLPAVLTVSSGAGSGSGEKNYITNPSMASATTGWNVVGDFTLTRTTAASELPREYTTGTGIKLVATSGTQSTADYMYFDFNLDDVDLGKKLKIQWSQKKIGTYSAGQLAVVITSQADRTTALITPQTTAIPASDLDFVTSFDSGSTAALSLVIRATTDMTTGDGIVISDVIVGPGEIVQGAAISEWQTYSSGSTVLPAGLSTQYRRVGDVGEFRVVGATTATSSSVFVIGLPTGLTFSSSFGVNQPLPGNAEVEDSVSAGAVFHGIPVYASSTTFKIKVSDKTTNAYWGNTTPVAFATNSGYRVMITTTISIAEFSGSGTINLGPGAQVEYAASTTGTWDAAASATNTVYGPEGVPVSGALTSNRTKTIRFQYPIQSDDMLTLEVKLANGNWVDIANSVAVYANQNTAAYGARLLGVSGSTTDVDVSFQQYIAPGTGYGNTAGANNWGTTFVTAWRVRKAKASSPVGFGLVSSANGSGLMPALTSQLDNSTATQFGLKQYLGDISGGSNDIAYNGSNKATISYNAGGGSITAVPRATFIPYQTQDGAWRLKFNIHVNASSATRTQFNIAVNGITAKNTSGLSQGIGAGVGNSSGFIALPAIDANTNIFYVYHASVSVIAYRYHGDIELDSKPTWAY